MRDASRAIAAAGLASGLSYAFWLICDDFGPQWGAGLFFGVLVLAPSAGGVLRRVALVVSSLATYRAAFWVAETLYSDAVLPDLALLSVVGAGGAAVLALAASGVLRRPPHWRSFFLGMLAGGLAGPSFNFALRSPDGSPIGHIALLLGFAIWQVGYTAAHRLRPWVSTAD